jgi:trehalose 6-phosphate synthase
MQFFRMRLILALVVGITLVSIASTYFQVLAHKHALRQELERRTAWQSKGLQSEMEKVAAADQTAEIVAEAAQLRSRNGALGLAVYDSQGGQVTVAGTVELFSALPNGPLDKAIKQGDDSWNTPFPSMSMGKSPARSSSWKMPPTLAPRARGDGGRVFGRSPHLFCSFPA